MAERTLEARLVDLGDALAFPRSDALADDVVGAIDGAAAAAVPPPASRLRRPLLVAAAVVLVSALMVVAIPSTRSAVARWLGFDTYRIEPVVELPDLSDVPPAGLVPGPGDLIGKARVDGRDVVVMSLPGQLEAGLFTKLVGTGTTITETSVGGRPAYWIAGEDHVLMYVDAAGVAEARLSANALVWQRGDRIVRVEGDVTLEQALAVAAREW